MWVHMYMHISCTFKYVVHYLPQNLVYTHLHATLVCTLVPVNTCDTPEIHYVEMDVTSTCFVCSTTCMVYSYSFFCQDDHYVRVQSSRLFTESTIVFSLQFSCTDLSACMWTCESELKSWCVLKQITSIYTV